MFLKIRGLPLPSGFYGYTPEDAFNEYSGELVALKDAMWPDDHTADVVAIFKEVGIKSPLDQKLVEPFLISFGGVEIDGVPDYSRADWGKLKDYFKYEAANFTDKSKCKEIQEMARAKYGHILASA